MWEYIAKPKQEKESTAIFLDKGKNVVADIYLKSNFKLHDDQLSPSLLLSPSCWLQNDIFFYVTVVAFVLLILLCNLSVFIVVLIQIRKMQANKPSVNSRSSLNDLRAVASLTVLLGLTWTLAFFSFGPARVVLMYLFSILNTLQGKDELQLVIRY